MKNILIAIYSFVFFFAIKNTKAQFRREYVDEKYAQLAFKFTPLTIAEFDNAIGLAIEYKPKPSIGIQLDGQYIFGAYYFDNLKQVNNASGFKICPELRMYDAFFHNKLHRYAGVRVGYKYVEKNVSIWENISNQLQMQKDTLLKKSHIHCAIIVGLQAEGRITGFDLTLGIGGKYKILNIEKYSRTGLRSFLPAEYGESITGFYFHPVINMRMCFYFARTSF